MRVPPIGTAPRGGNGSPKTWAADGGRARGRQRPRPAASRPAAATAVTVAVAVVLVPVPEPPLEQVAAR
ncbi:MAG: hypothetical protein MZV64_13725 [Ignavibacteriales bacterium]|nr:hypothetical protein [Ignavibacteriales bacterium]